MLPFRNSIYFLLPVLLAAFLSNFCLRAQTPARKKSASTANSAGKSLFTTSCAGCHGLDGRGGERAPNIASSPRMQHLSDSQIAGIISHGVPGTGMPAFGEMNDEQVRGVVSYLRTLQGKRETQALPGDPTHGKEIFFGKGDCSSCHMISGRGGFLGPDLSSYAANLPVNAILQGIVSKDRNVPTGFKLAAATTRDGNRVEGIVRNEDNFSVQLQSKDGAFHFFQKADLQNLEYLNTPLMPTNFGSRLTQSELNDLVAYLMVTSSQAGQTSRVQQEDPE